MFSENEETDKETLPETNSQVDSLPLEKDNNGEATAESLVLMKNRTEHLKREHHNQKERKSF